MAIHDALCPRCGGADLLVRTEDTGFAPPDVRYRGDVLAVDRRDGALIVPPWSLRCAACGWTGLHEWLRRGRERPAPPLPDGIERCPACAAPRGVPGGPYDGVLCRCSDVACRGCGRRAIRRPLSAYWREEDGRLIHVPAFGFLARCADCRAAAASGSVPRMRRHHIGCAPGDVAPAVLLPGDPARVERMAALLDDARHVATSREHVTYTGTTGGVPVSITSTGVGAPSTAIAAEELHAIGARLLIRVGTCGGIQDATRSGDLVIATGAVRGDGTTREYVDETFPAVADPDVTIALRTAARAAGEEPHVGIVRTHDAFYVESLLAHGDFRARVEPWRRAGVLAIENEAAALFVLGSLRGFRAGAICAVAGELYGMEPGALPPGRPERVDVATQVALAAVRALAAA